MPGTPQSDQVPLEEAHFSNVGQRLDIRENRRRERRFVPSGPTSSGAGSLRVQLASICRMYKTQQQCAR
jgi:hypothetical protein